MRAVVNDAIHVKVKIINLWNLVFPGWVGRQWEGGGGGGFQESVSEQATV